MQGVFRLASLFNMTLNSIVQRISEIKPLIESVMMLAGGVALIKWVSERRNRATDVLLGLEREFDVKCAAARSLIENDSEYLKIKDVLAGSIDGRESKVRLGRQLEIDNLLRFYLVLLAVRQARQIPDRPLSTCYRFWLAHYYRRDRIEFRHYVNTLFPTLSSWLIADITWGARIWNRPRGLFKMRFFRPDDFWLKESLYLDASDLS